jgi:hypothetical protein
MTSRRVAAVLFAVALAGCGDSEPRWKQRTAGEWAARLWSPDAKEAAEAHEALVSFAGSRPESVLAAVEAVMRRPPPPAPGTPFAARIDFEAAARLGLPPAPATSAIVAVLPVLRARIDGVGLVPTSTRADATGRFEFVGPPGRTADEIARAQTLLLTRGGLDVRAVVRAPGTIGGGRAYDGATPWADFLAAERRAAEEARASGTVPRPTDPRWRTVFDAPGAEPLVLEEPATPADAIDERLVESAEGLLAKDGSPAVRIQVRLERRGDLARFQRRHAGGEMAVLVNGGLRGRQPVPATDGSTLVVSPGPAPTGREPLGWAREHAMLWASGRLPWPMVPVPMPPPAPLDPPPENPCSRVAVALGAPAVPMLRRLEQDGPPWARASATWALARLGGR